MRERIFTILIKIKKINLPKSEKTITCEYPLFPKFVNLSGINYRPGHW